MVGKIERLYVKEGDWIDKGKPFLDLEKEAFVALRDSSLAQLEIQRSRLRQAELALADAQIKKTRAERLITEKIATKEQLETASLNWDSARQSLEQAKEGVTQITPTWRRRKRSQKTPSAPSRAGSSRSTPRKARSWSPAP